MYCQVVLFIIKKNQQMIEQGANMNEYNFRISTEKLQHEFQCTICLNPINDCYITRCGHVYCGHCIEQAVGRHHRCPFCNQQLLDFKLDVFKNYHFNTLKKIIDDERKRENEKYLNKMFEKVSRLRQDREGENELMAPVEKAIVEQCQMALLQYRQYLLELYALMKRGEQRRLEMGAEKVRTNAELVKELQTTILGSMGSPVVSPDLISLATEVEVVLPNKKTMRTTMRVSPIAPFSAILPFVENICSEMNVRIKGSLPQKLLINGQLRGLDQVFGGVCGKKVRVEGVPFEVNTFCFTHGWDKSKVTNFYSCKECSVKWICQNCSLLCHKDHNCVLQLKDHRPEWACCYCATKCNCQAINKNSVIKG